MSREISLAAVPVVIVNTLLTPPILQALYTGEVSGRAATTGLPPAPFQESGRKPKRSDPAEPSVPDGEG